jgi:hypothetical protein
VPIPSRNLVIQVIFTTFSFGVDPIRLSLFFGIFVDSCTCFDYLLDIDKVKYDAPNKENRSRNRRIAGT